MKLNDQELHGLRDMILKTSSRLIEKYKELNKIEKEADILFMGDSMIEFLDTKLFFPNYALLNRGIGGATTKFILDNLDFIVGDIKPNKLFISIGSNDLVLLRATPSEVVDNVINVFKILQLKFPHTKLYYLSTTPVLKEGNKLYKKIYVAGRTNEENQAINKGLKTALELINVTFINQYDQLVDLDGYLIENFTPDGIHLNKEGYKIYSNEIKKYL